MSAPDWTKRQLMAEFIATSTFVWAGCGTSVIRFVPHLLLCGIVDEPLSLLCNFQSIIY